MNLKKIMAVILVLCMVLAFAACAKKEAAPNTPVEQTQPAETKPAETKPAETKPAETKPEETKAPEVTPEKAPAEVVPEKTQTEVTPEKTPTVVTPEKTQPEVVPEKTPSESTSQKPETPKEPEIAPPTPAKNPVIEKLNDGIYTVDVKTDGGSFKITEGHNGKGLLYVSGGKMTANIVLSGTGDVAVFNVPSIGTEFEITTTVGKGAWDGHKVTVSTPVKISTKTITQITLTGGTGKTTVKTAETFTDLNGKTMALLTWSSKSLDWMEIGGVQYSPINTSGGCQFVVPVELGTDMAVSAQTSAMSTPHVIEYTLNLQ